MDPSISLSAQEIIENLLDVIDNAVLIVDSEHRIVFVNKKTEQMFGASSKTFLGLPVSHLFMPEDRTILAANILALAKKEGELKTEAMLARPDGTGFLGMIAVSLFNWQDTMEGMAFTIHDLTELKTVERSLNHSERIAFLGHLLDDLAHQIRNPVTAIGGIARRLDVEAGGSHETMAILSEAMRLEKLLHRLNRFITLSSPVAKSVSIGSFLDRAHEQLGEIVRLRNCRWSVECEPDLKDALLLIDVDLLLESMTEVVLNGCESYEKFEGDRKIICRVSRSDESEFPYVTRIIDHGVGIAANQLPHVFSHFYSNKTRHVGIGLTLARRIVEEQYGRLTIASETSEGTVVSFYLLEERRRLIRRVRLFT